MTSRRRGGGTGGALQSAGARARAVMGGLAFRVLAFLTLALLPLGLIAIQQTRSYQIETEARSELSILALTAQAASGERELMERTFGAADALGVVAAALEDTGSCATYLGPFIDAGGLYDFVGLVRPSGEVLCSTSVEPANLSGAAWFDEWMSNQRPTITVTSSGFISGRGVIVVSQPIFQGDRFEGFVSVSIPAERLRVAAASDIGDGPRPLQLITFNREGEVLSRQVEGAASLLPPQLNLSTFPGQRPLTFTGVDADGIPRLYAMAPVVPGLVYALGVWELPEEIDHGFWRTVSLWLYPLLMWLASLIVAYYAVERLVIRDIRTLADNIDAFGRDRRLPGNLPRRGQADELKRIEEAFLSMAESILRDEAQLENTVRERGILLKEVHHRVKNNLQLISSIMSMQMRRTRDPQTRSILSRLQERVLGLATIHRSLYQDEDIGRVDAARLLREIATQQTAGLKVDEMRLELDRVELLPDQAVPLALLTAESLANARGNIRPDADGSSWISLRLERVDAETARVEIANSAEGTEQARPAGAGLGLNLIQAFAAQLGSHAETAHGAGHYRLEVRFAIRATQPDALDY